MAYFIVNNGVSLNFAENLIPNLTPNVFYGDLTEQWTIKDDGKGGVVIASKANEQYVTVVQAVEGATLSVSPSGSTFNIIPNKEGKGGYKIRVPNTNLGVNVGPVSVTLLPLADVKPLFFAENTPENIKAISDGKVVDSQPPGVTGPIIPQSTIQTWPKLIISQLLPVPSVSPGVADIIGFGTSGVSILRNSINVKRVLVVPNFMPDTGGWNVQNHVRLVADTTGNRRADIVGFGDEWTFISFNNGDNSFLKEPKPVVSGFGYNNGWRKDKHIRYMADIRNTGRADIVGFGDGGVYVSLNNGNGNFSPRQLAVADFGYDTTWRIEKHLRFLADVNGNGLLDIVAFGETYVFVGFNNGDGTFQFPKDVLQDLCYTQGYHVEKHPRFVVDLTGDGRPDLLAFGEDGVYVSLNNGNGTFQPTRKVSNEFGYKDTWRVEKHPRFVVDLTGNRARDIIGFGDGGVYVAFNNGDGTFGQSKVVIDNFGYNQTWRVELHPRVMADLTGDGRADIVGFGTDKVYVSYNDGKGNFGPIVTLIDDFGLNQGWTIDKTERYVTNLYH